MPEDAEEHFPHIYGAVPVHAVVSLLQVTRRGDGAARMPDLSGLGVLARPLRNNVSDDR